MAKKTPAKPVVTAADVLASAAAYKAAGALRLKRLPNEEEQALIAWHSAIQAWLLGEPQKLVDLLAADGAVPPPARAWLADLAAGKVKKRPGRRATIAPIGEALRKKFAEWDIQERFRELLEVEQSRPALRGDSPKDRAILKCASEFGMSESAVSQIVYPRRGSE